MPLGKRHSQVPSQHRVEVRVVAGPRLHGAPWVPKLRQPQYNHCKRCNFSAIRRYNDPPYSATATRHTATPRPAIQRYSDPPYSAAIAPYSEDTKGRRAPMTPVGILQHVPHELSWPCIVAFAARSVGSI
ncbi:hypothetical protein HRG_012478 [Hirsutella rhossiliensis]